MSRWYFALGGGFIGLEGVRGMHYLFFRGLKEVACSLLCLPCGEMQMGENVDTGGRMCDTLPFS